MIQEGTEISPEERRIERLQNILKQEQLRDVSYQEALEIGEALLTFFKTLAEESEGSLA